MTVRCFAPAKINLMLHVINKQADGFHHLQSLVTFGAPPLGDILSFDKADHFSLEVTGPFGSGLTSVANNSITRAAHWLGTHHPGIEKAHIVLTKSLPIAAGIGGGTSDAAATLAGLLTLNGIRLSPQEEDDLILVSGELGADVPMCLAYQFGRGPLLWIDGSGRETLPLPVKGQLPGTLLLVNPGIPVSTADIFHHFRPPYTPSQKRPACDPFLLFLQAQNNDLITATIQQVPIIKDILNALEKSPKCLLARMSGTGATCFGLFDNQESAEQAQIRLNEKFPKAWVMVGPVGLEPTTTPL